jgi:MFS family permease
MLVDAVNPITPHRCGGPGSPRARFGVDFTPHDSPVRCLGRIAVTKRHHWFDGLSRDTVLLSLSSLFADISTEMLYPIQPIFLTQYLKASGSLVGLVEGLAQATQNIVQGLSGWLSDHLQRRKPVAIFGYALAAVSKPLIGLSTAWQGVLGARFLDRLGAGTRSAPRDALVAASVEPQHRGKAFGLEGAGDNLGAFIGPLVAVVLLIRLHVDIRTIFYLAIIPGLLALAMVLFVRERSVRVHAKATLDLRWHEFPAGYWKYLMVTAVFGIGNSSNSFLILRTKDIGASLQTTILIYAAFNLVAALISYPAGFISDRLGRRNVLLAAFAVFALAYLGFALTQDIVVMALLFIFYGLFQGIFRSVGKAMAADFVPDELRASGIGWFSTVVGLSGLVGSIVAGLMWDHIGHAAVFGYGTACATLGCVALVALLPSRVPGPTRNVRPRA